jgi:metallo-beta-lactamase class B
VKELTGAQVMVMQGDDGGVARGGSSDEIVPRSWRPCTVDRVLHDGDEVKLGGVKLVARLTPGHTKGCTTWTLQTVEGDRTYNVVVVGSLGVTVGARLVNNTAYPEIANDYARAFRVLKTLSCDVFLANHGVFYGLKEKYSKLAKGEANPFVDSQGYRQYLERAERAFQGKLAEQRKGTQ